MENKINTTIFLDSLTNWNCPLADIELTVPARAMHLDANSPEPFEAVVIMPNLLLEMKPVRSVIFSVVPGSSWFFSLYLIRISRVSALRDRYKLRTGRLDLSQCQCSNKTF